MLPIEYIPRRSSGRLASLGFSNQRFKKKGFKFNYNLFTARLWLNHKQYRPQRGLTSVKFKPLVVHYESQEIAHAVPTPLGEIRAGEEQLT